MNVNETILDTIGNTPLIRLIKLTAECKANIFAKVDSMYEYNKHPRGKIVIPWKKLYLRVNKWVLSYFTLKL